MSSLRPERIGLDDFADQPVSVCGKSFRAHMSGALYWPSQNALILSDLQLLRSSSMALAWSYSQAVGSSLIKQQEPLAVP